MKLFSMRLRNYQENCGNQKVLLINGNQFDSNLGFLLARILGHCRNYEELYSFERCSTIEKLTLLFQSEPMFLLLSQLTGLELSDGSCVEQKENGASCERTASCSGDEQTAGSPPESGLGPRCVASVRRWSHGSYTLLRDTEKMDNFLLDSTLFLVKGGGDGIKWYCLGL